MSSRIDDAFRLTFEFKNAENGFITTEYDIGTDRSRLRAARAARIGAA